MNTSASTPNIEAETDRVLEIAVGVLRDAHGRILIAQRRPGTQGAGYWEFPGGKHEAGETIETTLARELQEELGIVPLAQRRLIRMHNPAAEQAVRLHVWLISDWQGTPQGREGQRVTWCPESELGEPKLLPGSHAIINALRLPNQLAITPDVASCERAAWFDALDATLRRNIRLLRLRAPALDDAAYAELAAEVVVRARAADVQVLLDRSPVLVRDLGAAGLHWPARRAASVGERPIGLDYWFGVSAHHSAELRAAARLEADFAVLSPVCATDTHPERKPLQWAGWRQARADLDLPVYALGGLTADDLDKAHACNAQGVAAIRAFWGASVGTA